MAETVPRKFRMPPWKWSLRSAAWAVPVGMVFAVPISLSVLYFCIVLGLPIDYPDSVDASHKMAVGIFSSPGRAFITYLPFDWIMDDRWTILAVFFLFLFGLPYAWSFFFLLFTFLGFTPLNRVPMPIQEDFENTEHAE